MRRPMNTGLQKVGVISYLKARSDDFSEELIDLTALIDSTLTLTENCKNIATQIGVPLETPAEQYQMWAAMARGQ